MNWQYRGGWRTTCALILLASLPGCSGPAEFLLRPDAELRWPEGDVPARIGYEFAYHGYQDVDRDPGFFGGMVEFVVGSKAAELVHPRGLVLDPDEVLWIADPGAGAVHRLDLISGEHRTMFGSAEQPLQSPIGVACVPDGRVFVTDSVTGRISIFDASGDLIEQFGEDDEFGRPTGIAFDPRKSLLLVTDTTGHRVLMLDLEGELQSSFGKRGDKIGEFNFPTDLAIGPNGEIAIVDAMNFRVQRFDSGLQPTSTFGVAGRGPGSFNSPKGIAYDSEGHLYVADAMFDNVQIFDVEGRLLLPFGEQGTELGQFYLPSGICIDDQDRIFVTDSGNARLQVFRYLGGQE